MIALEDARLALGSTPILDGVTLRVRRGEMACLLGPSGCGKTSLLNVIAGILQVDRGEVTVATERIGYVFQDDRLLPWRSVRQNVLVGISGYLHGAEAAQAADQWLERVGLADSAGARPASLSGGMKRRLNLARALAMEPELLLLDEPFAFLDPEAVEVVTREIRALHEQRGVTVVVVSHVMEHVRPLAPRILTVAGPPVTRVEDGAAQ